MYSIIIPSHKNPEYLKLCIESIIKNSYYKTHQICVHLDGYDKESIDYLNIKDLNYTMSKNNIGVPRSFNILADTSIYKELIFAHDDFYFTKNWDYNLHRWEEEIDKRFPDYLKFIGHRLCEPNPGSFPPLCNCGKTIDEFNEDINHTKLYSYIERNCPHKIGGCVDGWIYQSLYPTKICQEVRWSTDINTCADIDFAMRILRYLRKNKLKFLMFTVKDLNMYHFQTTATPKSKLPQIGCEKFKDKWNMELSDARKIIENEVIRSESEIWNK